MQPLAEYGIIFQFELSFLRFMQEREVRGRPVTQVFAYSQVLKGGELNIFFADFGTSLVIYRRRRMIPWTSAIEWFLFKLGYFCNSTNSKKFSLL